MIYRYSKFLITFGNISPCKNNFLVWLGFKPVIVNIGEKSTFILTCRSSHFVKRQVFTLQDLALRRKVISKHAHFVNFWAFLLPAAVAEVAVAICLKFPNVCHVRWSGIHTYSKCKLQNSRWYFHLATSNTFGMSRTR